MSIPLLWKNGFSTVMEKLLVSFSYQDFNCLIYLKLMKHLFLLLQTFWSSFYVIFYAYPFSGKPSWSYSHLTHFLVHLQAHCLCVQVICTSQTLHLHWRQCPVSIFDLAGKQAEVRWLLWKCWFTFQQCFEGNWDKFSRKLLVLALGLIWIISARHKLITTHSS